MYSDQEFSGCPICDTDIWVDINIAKIESLLFKKYEKIVIADVVYNEIMKWKDNLYFSFIATNLEKYISECRIAIINHDQIEIDDRRFLEKQLSETGFNFVNGLRDCPHEKNKGEIVSALYAEHFETAFLKSNDSTFKKGNAGRQAFPDLQVKNRWDTLLDLLGDVALCREKNQLINDNRALMNEGKRIHIQELESKESKPISINDVEILLKRMRGGR